LGASLTYGQTEDLNNNDLSQVAGQRIALKQWFAVDVLRVLILAGPGKLILLIVI